MSILRQIEVIITRWKVGEIPGYYAEIFKLINESEEYIEANQLRDKQVEDYIV